MPYQNSYKNKYHNRRCWKCVGRDPKDGERLSIVVSFKFKNKNFARPVILTGKMANEYFLNEWRKNGWTEGDEWEW